MSLGPINTGVNKLFELNFVLHLITTQISNIYDTRLNDFWLPSGFIYNLFWKILHLSTLVFNSSTEISPVFVKLKESLMNK